MGAVRRRIADWRIVLETDARRCSSAAHPRCVWIDTTGRTASEPGPRHGRERPNREEPGERSSKTSDTGPPVNRAARPRGKRFLRGVSIIIRKALLRLAPLNGREIGAGGLHLSRPRSLGSAGRCNTTMIWSVADGIEAGTPCAREARFWELLRQGLGRTAACDAVGVDRRQGYRWVTAAGGRNPFAHTPRSDRYLSQEERLQIADLHLGDEGVRAIAKTLGRSRSTISRELTTNAAAGGTYRPYSAEKQCRVRARRPKSRKLDRVELALQVELLLVRNWSPEQVRDDLTRTFPNRPETHVSHETIYQSLFVQGRGHLRADLHRPRHPPAPW